MKLIISATHQQSSQMYFEMLQFLQSLRLISVLSSLVTFLLYKLSKLWIIYHCFGTKCIQWLQLSNYTNSSLTQTQPPPKRYLPTYLQTNLHIYILFSKLLNLNLNIIQNWIRQQYKHIETHSTKKKLDLSKQLDIVEQLWQLWTYLTTLWWFCTVDVMKYVLVIIYLCKLCYFE